MPWLYRDVTIASFFWFTAFLVGLLVGDTEVIDSVAMIAFESRKTEVSALHLLLHNSGVLCMLALGAVTGGILSVALLIINGVVLGIVVGKALLIGLSIRSVALVTLPHIAEVFGFILAGAIGIRGGRLAVQWLLVGDEPPKELILSLSRALGLAFSLVVVGAVNEALISIPLAKIIGSR